MNVTVLTKLTKLSAAFEETTVNSKQHTHECSEQVTTCPPFKFAQHPQLAHLKDFVNTVEMLFQL